MNTTVVIPTYNERENIEPMLDAILALNVPDLSILVVDDSSPDGTGEVVRERSKKNSRISLLTRTKKEGLGRAYIAGFQEAMRRGAEAVVEIDADFSHDPNDIPRLLRVLERADFVVGSRYLHGSGVKDWSPARRWLSRCANLYARVVTGVPVTDLTAGFVAIRASLLRTIDLPSIRADGYGFQIESKFRAQQRGARIEEIPIVFRDRRVGQSKMSWDILWEALFIVWKLRAQKNAQGR